MSDFFLVHYAYKYLHYALHSVCPPPAKHRLTIGVLVSHLSLVVPLSQSRADRLLVVSMLTELHRLHAVEIRSLRILPALLHKILPGKRVTVHLHAPVQAGPGPDLGAVGCFELIKHQQRASTNRFKFSLLIAKDR